MSLPFPAHTGEQVVPERAKRLKRRPRVSLVVFLGLALTVGVAGKALAWHTNLSASANCDGATVKITTPDEDWVEDDTTASGTVSLAGTTKSWSIAKAGTATVGFPGVTEGGTAVVSGTFNTGENAGGSVSVPVASGCEEETPPVEKPEPPVEEQPPVETPDKPEVGTPTSKKRTRTEPNPDDSIPAPNYTPPEFDGRTGPTPFTG